MKSVRFSKVVEKSGRPEVYLLMTETDPDFQKALEAGRIMSLSGESHGAGLEYGTVGYDKKRHGQLLLFPRSLKSFAGARVIGIKYDLFAEDRGGEEKKSSSASGTKHSYKSKKEPSAKRASAKNAPKKATKPKKSRSKPATKKVIPFPARKENPDDEEDEDLKVYVRQAMQALEKGNSVAAYNILKRIIPEQ